MRQAKIISFIHHDEPQPVIVRIGDPESSIGGNGNPVRPVEACLRCRSAVTATAYLAGSGGLPP
jgi:hypothetical protein